MAVDVVPIRVENHPDTGNMMERVAILVASKIYEVPRECDDFCVIDGIVGPN